MMRPIFILAILACSAAIDRGPIGFDLHNPSRTYTLPPELTEISALTDVDASTIACLHDEEAMLYFIDLRTGKIQRKIAFGEPGDMEGLTRVGDEYFALRSDGFVYRFKFHGDRPELTDTFRLSIPNRNIEGLGWDPRRNVILVSPKDTPRGKPEVRDARNIHCYDPIAKRMCDRPALTLSIKQIIAQAGARGFEVPMKENDKGKRSPALKLRFSSVAIDPLTDTYFLLSATDRILLVIDRKGDLIALEQLDEDLFSKPEGITFLENGDMLISNEGKDSKPNIHLFSRQEQ